ncbi:MAG: sulfatase [Pirellulales bacterium]|nr:sulfatase [Pirellulales bacterium]
MKRTFAALMWLCLLALWAPTSILAESSAPDRPNIVLILADDLNWNDLGCYGNKEVKTPNIDRLASEGLRFTHCYTATAMCAPTRQQLYTGVFPVRNGAFPNHSKVKSGTRSLVHHFGNLGYRVGLTGKKHFGPPSSFPFVAVKKDGSRKFMTGNEPFFLVVASNSPHTPWPKPEGYDPEKLTLKPNMVDTPETRQALASYYTEVTQLDDQVGKYMKMVDDLGIAKNTIFIFSSEQGSNFPFAKWTCYDLGLRTALIMRWPGHIKPGTTTDAMVQYVDIVPTLLEAVGGKPAKVDTGLPSDPNGGRGFDGTSFLHVLRGKADRHRDHAFGVHTTRGIIAGSDYPVRSIRDERYKLILNLNHKGKFSNVVQAQDREGYWKTWLAKAETDPTIAPLVKKYYKRPAVEFYDLDDDPYEMNNLADQPQYAPRIATMKRALEDWMKAQGDRGMSTELAASGRKKPRTKPKSR